MVSEKENIMSTFDLNKFIDSACVVAEEGFHMPDKVVDALRRSPKRKNKASSASGNAIAARQIAAAYEEHAVVIESLRKELVAAKAREKALIDGFTDKFKEIQKASPSTFEKLHASTKTVSTPMPFDEQDMPMDEMADAARMERDKRAMEQLEQKRLMEEFKRKVDQQMTQLQRKNQEEIQKISDSLDLKVAEMEKLKKRFDSVALEKDYYKKQSTELEHSLSSVSPHSSPVGRRHANNPNIPEPPSMTGFSPGTRYVTPLQRLRETQKENKNSTPPTNSTISTMDSAADDPGAISSAEKSIPPPVSRLDSLFSKVTDPNLNAMHDILQVVEREILQDEKVQNVTSKPIDLNKDEREFVEKIKGICESSNKEHETLITSLQKELEETSDALQEGESKSSQVMKVLDEKNKKIKDLEYELLLAKESSVATSSLQGMLKMVADDQKSNKTEHIELKTKLSKMEKEKEKLLAERRQSQEESHKAIAALRRVLADATSEREAVTSELQAKLDGLATENAVLKTKLDPSIDTENIVTVTISREEFEKLCQDARKNNTKSNDEMVLLQLEELKKERNSFISLADDLDASRTQCVGLEKEVTRLKDETLELRAALKESQLEVKNTSIKCKEDYRDIISNMQSEKKELSEKCTVLESELDTLKLQARTAKEVMKTAKDVHAREKKLEDELTSVQHLLNGAMEEKSKLEQMTKSKTGELREQKEKLQQLQEAIIDMKEEKLALTSRAKEAESALERSSRIMSLMQETSDTGGTASKAILDLKELLHEQQDLHTKLRFCCDDDAHFMIDNLDKKVHTTLCLLETDVLTITGVDSIVPFDLSNTESSLKERLLEKTLTLQRAENERINKNVEELQNEKDQETSILASKIATLEETCEQKEEELKKLRSSGYISDVYSETDDDTIPKEISADTISQSDEDMSSMVADLQILKDKAEKEAKENAESLANAKMIISSLENSNRSIVESLKERLSDSNAAIVSLLEQSKKQDKISAGLRRDLALMVKEKQSLEMKVSVPRIEKSENISE